MSRMGLHEVLCMNTSTEPYRLKEQELMPLNNIMEVLRRDGKYKILIATLADTELDTRLRSTGPYTLFAPTDEAFQNVPKLAEFLHDVPRLREVLSRHIVWGYLDARAVWGIHHLAPIGGKSIRITSVNMRIEDAEVVQANLQALNGMIHGVNRVFMDENFSLLREAGTQLEEGLKSGATMVANAVKAGAAKLDHVLHPQKKDQEQNSDQVDPNKTKPLQAVHHE